MVDPIRIRGLAELRRRMAEIGRADNVRSAAMLALLARGVRIMNVAKLLVPVDQGTLRATGNVIPLLAVGQPEVLLSFGGPAAPYALVQHENLTFRHVVGGPKYLEAPVLAEGKGLLNDLRDQVRALLIGRQPKIIAAAKSIKRLRGKGRLSLATRRRRLLGLVG